MLISESEKYSLLPLPSTLTPSSLSLTNLPFYEMEKEKTRPCELDFYRLEEFDFLDKACNDRKLYFSLFFLKQII
jgi:hypothetical protein